MVVSHYFFFIFNYRNSYSVVKLLLNLLFIHLLTVLEHKFYLSIFFWNLDYNVNVFLFNTKLLVLVIQYR